jgi:hypothetical protein
LVGVAQVQQRLAGGKQPATSTPKKALRLIAVEQHVFADVNKSYMNLRLEMSQCVFFP